MPNFEQNQSELDQKPGNSHQPSTNQNNYRSLIPLLLGAGLIIMFDQWTKHLVVDNIPFLGTWMPENFAQYHGYFRIVHWRNSGAAFGMFSSGNTIFLILAIVASIFIIAFYPLIDKEEWPLRIAMVLQLGGALGNMIDRLRYGYVVDFISFTDLPVFNIADASISTGVAILLLGVLYQEIKTQKLNKSLDDFSTTESRRQKEAEK